MQESNCFTGLTPSVYNKIYERLKHSKSNSIYINDNYKTIHRFFLYEKNLYCRKKVNNTYITTQCISLDDYKEKMKEPFKQEMIIKLKNDFPAFDENEIEAQADILAEANESIKNLIKLGFPPAKASEIVKYALSIDDNERKTIEDNIRCLS